MEAKDKRKNSVQDATMGVSSEVLISAQKVYLLLEGSGRMYTL